MNTPTQQVTTEPATNAGPDCALATGSVSPIIREWRDEQIQWYSFGRNYWRATFNNQEIGTYCAEPSEYRDGIVVYFGNTKFRDYARTEEEARHWMEATFREWLKTTAALSQNDKGQP